MFSVPIQIRAMLAVACACVLAPSTAQADQYVVDHCKNWDTGAGGVAFGDFAGATTNDCGAGGGLHMQVQNGRMAPNASVAMRLTIPADRPNITIERVQTQYGAPAPTTFTPNGGTPFLVLFNHLGQQVRNNIPPATPVVDTLLPPGARSLEWNLYCANDAAGNPCTFADDFLLHVYKTRLYLNEAAAPALTVTGGSLTSEGAKAGEQSVAFDVSDADSGVASVTVSLGATVVGTAQYACPGRDWSACQRDRSGQVLPVDTTKVPDGAHELLVTARDAANNATTRTAGTVTVANGAPSVPNGTGASRLAKLSARFATTTRRVRNLKYRSRPTVRGRLVNEAGQPIAGANVAVLEQRKRAGAPTTQLATVATAADGSFSHKLGPGPSRTITLAYTAFSSDPAPTTTSALRTVVRAPVIARIGPRSVRAGGRVRITGRLGLLGREGIEVKVQGRNGRRWQTIGDAKTKRRGTFGWSYRFSRAAAGRTFAFRVRVSSPIYPFATSTSRTLVVRVR